MYSHHTPLTTFLPNSAFRQNPLVLIVILHQRQKKRGSWEKKIKLTSNNNKMYNLWNGNRSTGRGFQQITSTTDTVFFRVSVLKCHLQEESCSRLIAEQVQRKSSVTLRFRDYKNKTYYECVKLKTNKNPKKLLKHISEKTSICTFGLPPQKRADMYRSLNHKMACVGRNL